MGENNLSETDKNFYSGHRDRLRAKFLDGHLADYEKLELLLTYANVFVFEPTAKRA